MRVILSLLLLIAAGISLILLPESFFGIPTEDLKGFLRFWEATLKAFAIPLCLILLRFSKNALVRFSTVLWGFWVLLVTVAFILKVEEHAPALNLYGKIFVAATLVASLTVFLFSAIEFSPKRVKSRSSENPPVNPS